MEAMLIGSIAGFICACVFVFICGADPLGLGGDDDEGEYCI